MTTVTAGSSKTFTAQYDGSSFIVTMPGGSVGSVLDQSGRSQQFDQTGLRRVYGPLLDGQSITVSMQAGSAVVDLAGWSGAQPVTTETDTSGNQVLDPGSALAVVPQYTWANRPTTGFAAGRWALFTDIGPLPGTLMMWSGTRWVKNELTRLAGSAAPGTTLTGTLTATDQVNLTIPGQLLGPNGYLEVRFRATVNNSANAHLVQITLGGTLFFNAGPTTQTYQGGTARISNRNSLTAQIGTPLNLALTDANGVNAQQTGTVNTANDQSLKITFTLANTGDTMLLEAWEVLFCALP